MQKTPSKGTFIALIIIIVVALLLYFYYKGSPSDSAVSSLSTINTAESADAQASGDRVLSLLSEIRSLKIDSHIFQNPVYRTLVDYTVSVPEQSVGRVNPFAPIGL